jgi:hypothetical protein
MTPTAIEIVPVLWVFAAWLGATLAFFANGITICRLNLPPLARDPAADARFYSERESETKFRETYLKRFASSEVLYLLMFNGAGGCLLYVADEGVLWAAAFFALVAAWLIYDYASAPATLNEMNPRLVGNLDRVYFYGGALVWAYCLACIGSRWLGKF